MSSDFHRTRLAHSTKRRANAGLAKQHKPFANIVSLIHSVSGTRTLNRRFPVSLKLPSTESRTRTCDSCTTRKSVPFQVRAKFDPLCKSLQLAVRFLRVLLPAPPTALLAGRLPSHDAPRAWRRVGLTTFPVLPTQQRCTCACTFSVRISPGSTRDDVPLISKANRLPTVWFEPHSRFGSSVLTRAVHIRYACGTCVAPTPHGCWQCRFLPCHHGEPSTEGDVVSEASHPTITNRARPDRHLLVVQQVAFRQVPNVARQERALPSTALPIYVRRTATRIAR